MGVRHGPARDHARRRRITLGTAAGLGSLAAAGESVTFIERPETAAVLAERGLRLTRGGATQVVRDVTVHTAPADALSAGPHDVAVFALKSFDTATALDELLATGLPVPPVLSLQNGVDNEPLIAGRLGPDGVDHGVRPAAVGPLAQLVGDAVVRRDLDRVDPMILRHLQPLGHEVDPNHLLRALVLGDACAHLADRPKPEHGHATALRDRRVVDRLPGGR